MHPLRISWREFENGPACFLSHFTAKPWRKGNFIVLVHTQNGTLGHLFKLQFQGGKAPFESMVVLGSRQKVGSVAYNPPIGSIYQLYKLYTTYSPCLLGGLYTTDPTF